MSRRNHKNSEFKIDDFDPSRRRIWMDEGDPSLNEEMATGRLIEGAAACERLAKIREKRNRIHYIYAKYSSVGNTTFNTMQWDQKNTMQETTPLLIHQSPKHFVDDRDASSCDEREHRSGHQLTVPELLQRCSITVSRSDEAPIEKPTHPTSSSMKRATNLEKRRSVHSRSAKAIPSQNPNISKKSVHFYKYDEVIHSSNKTEYVYSLYEKETEQEKAEYDVVDDIEGVVSDLGYFFQCLSEGLQEEANKKLFQKSNRSRHNQGDR